MGKPMSFYRFLPREVVKAIDFAGGTVIHINYLGIFILFAGFASVVLVTWQLKRKR